MASLTMPDITALLPWYLDNARKLPWRETKDPYRIWVSEIMLQQTRVEAVIPYYHNFLDCCPDVAALAALPEATLLKLWEGLGYYSRVRNMQKAARVIMAEHGGVFPSDYGSIRALPGIGDYTAGAIASFAFDLPYPAVDGNVLRVSARLLGFGEDILAPASKRALTAAVAAAQPPEHAAEFNQAMIELGAVVCLPNGAPRCEACPLREACAARALGVERELPRRRAPAPRRVEERTVLILRSGERVAIRRRPAHGLLAGMFEPYSLSGKLDEARVRAHLADFGISPLRITPLGEGKHIFTHIEWHMVGFEVILHEKDAETVSKMDHCDLFFAPRYEIDKKYAVPTAYRTYRPYM